MLDDNEIACMDNVTVTLLKVVTGVSIVLGTVSISMGLLVISFIVLLKRYQFHSQRLVLYLSITVIMVGLKGTIDVNALVETTAETSAFCVACAFLLKYSLTVQICVIFIITFDTFLLVSCHINTSTVMVELVEVLVAFLLPLLWIWVPLLYNKFGSDGAICGITRINFTSCKKDEIGVILSASTVTVPFFIVLAVIVILYIVIVALLRRALHSTYEGIYDPQANVKKKETMKRAKYLLIYPTTYIILAIVDLAIGTLQAFDPQNYVVVLNLLEVVANMGKGIAVLIVYSFGEKETWRQLHCNNLRSACKRCFSKEHQIKEYTITTSVYHEFTDSLDNSYRKIGNVQDTQIGTDCSSQES